MQDKISIVHVFGGRQRGGVRTSLENWLTHSDKNIYRHTVIAHPWGGELGPEIDALGVKVVRMKVHPTDLDELEAFDTVNKFFTAISEEVPDALFGWNHHGNYFATRAAELFPAFKMPVVFWRISSLRNVEETNEPELKKLLELNSGLSHDTKVKRIICASRQLPPIYEKMGYDIDKMRVKYNGVNIKKFAPDLTGEKKRKIRDELGIPQDVKVIGMAAQFLPLKDQKGFLLAAAKMQAEREDVHFLLCGTGNQLPNPTLEEYIKETGINPKRLHLLGQRKDMERVFHALDVCTMCSSKEVFANVVLEALASGIPVVSTKAGEPEITIKNEKLIIPVRDPSDKSGDWEGKLTKAWDLVLSRTPDECLIETARNRGRILRVFNQDQYAEGIEKMILKQIIKNSRERSNYLS